MTRLGSEYQSLKSEIDRAIQEVLSSGRYTLEAELEQFEHEFAAYVGSAFAIGVGSGSDALNIALLSADIGEGAEVITAPNTDNPTAAAIAHAGATVVFADVDRRTFNLNPESVEAAITSDTKAILPIHLFGQPANLDELCRIADFYDLTLIEDAALAVGATYRESKVGTFGRMGCFSLAPSKILGAFGDAGIIVTDDSGLADRARSLRNYGHAPGVDLDPNNLTGGNDWTVLSHGFNSRLDAIQAAALRVKLRTVDDRIQARRRAAFMYNDLLAGSGVETPASQPDAQSVYFAYTILVEHRDQVRQSLESNGVATRLYYNPPLHLQPAFEELGHTGGDFPIAEEIARHSIALPIFPQITRDEVEWVASCVLQALVD